MNRVGIFLRSGTSHDVAIIFYSQRCLTNRIQRACKFGKRFCLSIIRGGGAYELFYVGSVIVHAEDLSGRWNCISRA